MCTSTTAIFLVFISAMIGGTAAENSTKIYIATTGGIHAVSVDTFEQGVILSKPPYIYGITFDAITQKLFFSDAESIIYRANPDGSSIEPVYTQSTSLIVGLAVDSVTGMLYGLDFEGSVFECDTRTSSNSLTCETFASGGGLAPGLALDPTHGKVYWTTFVSATGKLMSANMDGSGANATAVTEILSLYLTSLSGVALDSSEERLYLTISDGSSYGIQSCDLDGGDLRLVLQLQEAAVGILIHNERIYWTTIRNEDGKLQSCTKEGTDIRTHYETFEKFRQLTIGQDTGDYRGAH